MTVHELRTKLNRMAPPPETYLVDAETYGKVCQEVFNWYMKGLGNYHDEFGNPRTHENPQDVIILTMCFGKNGGILFKNVELLIKD